jgi:xanthine dehydrogenase YagT iron-sulfur-binding subunit
MPEREPAKYSRSVNRRSLLQSAAAAPVGVSIMTSVSVQAQTPPPTAAGIDVPIILTVNGQERQFRADARTTLLDALREKLSLTGAKKGCDHGQCGACTVHVGGRRVLSCLTLAVAAQGKAVTTIEGLAGIDGTLHPMQTAFIAHDAFQCGYCTPGQIMSAVALVAEGHAESDAAIREYMSGNLCRCAAYPNIVAAINEAKSQMRKV